MKPADLGGRLAEWLDGSGPSADVVLSSRVRLARTSSGVAFPNRADDARLSSAFDSVESAIHGAGSLGRSTLWDLDVLSPWDRRLLVERHLATSRLLEGRGRRGVWVIPGERLGMMINEEDHLRIQSVVSGFDLVQALRGAVELDRELETALEYAVTKVAVTSPPAQQTSGPGCEVGARAPSGSRARGEIGSSPRRRRDGNASRGWFGEGSHALGDFHQVSNQRAGPDRGGDGGGAGERWPRSSGVWKSRRARSSSIYFARHSDGSRISV